MWRHNLALRVELAINYPKILINVFLSVMIHFVISVPLLLAARNAKMDIISQRPKEHVCFHVMYLIANFVISHQLVPDVRLVIWLILLRLNAQQFVMILLAIYALFLHFVIFANLALSL